MSEEEAIERLKERVKLDRKIRNNKIESDYEQFCENECQAIETILNLADKQQKEIERLNEIINSRYYHDLKCRELEKEINENWEDKIRELKEKIKKEQTSNPYDFIYMLNELLGEDNE